MARSSVRQMWKAKLEGRLGAKTWPEPGALARPAYRGRVLGIDPSLRGTGLALLEFAPGRQPLLLRCVSELAPDHVALEQTIYVQNFQTAQILGAARGAAIAAAALRDCEVFEYPPLRVKQAVTGQGRASKEQVARTVMAMLGHGRMLAVDEADAAGVALCHALTWRQ